MKCNYLLPVFVAPLFWKSAFPPGACRVLSVQVAQLNWDFESCLSAYESRCTLQDCAVCTVASSVGSKSVGNGFDHALWSHSWNNSRERVVGSIEQSTELSYGAFASSIHH